MKYVGRNVQQAARRDNELPVQKHELERPFDDVADLCVGMTVSGHYASFRQPEPRRSSFACGQVLPPKQRTHFLPVKLVPLEMRQQGLPP